MRLLHRYVLKSFLTYLCLSIAFFSGVLLTGNLMRGMLGLLSSGKISFGQVIFLLTTLLPSIISYALPFGFVCATLIVVGQMSANQEITVLKGTGISPLKIIASIILTASLAVIFSLAINFYYAPNAVTKVKKEFQEIIKREPLRFITPETFIYDFPGYIIYVKTLNEERLQNFHIWELDSNDKVSTYIQAKTGTLKYNQKKQALVLTLAKGIIEKQLEENSNSPIISFENLSLELPLKMIFKEENFEQKKLRHMNFSELIQYRDIALKNHNFEKQIAAQTQIQNNFVMAFAIIALVLIAIPLSLKFQKKETFGNISLALLISVGYYFLIMIISFLEKRPHARPDLLLWIPNLVLNVVGIKMLWNFGRH